MSHKKCILLSEALLPEFTALLAKEKIPLNPSHIDSLATLYIPLSAMLASKQKDTTLIIGINGSQGAGKTTLTKILSIVLKLGFHKTVTHFSIDDLYKSREQRKLLSETIHPLLATRGVPGTHDTDLGISIFEQLLNKKQTKCLIPAFDKSIDERLPEAQWQYIDGHCDIVLFEGWCVGSVAQNENQLKAPINKLEKSQDSDARWRHFVNKQLNGSYAKLFSFIDILIMLEIPDFDNVYKWRKLQEQKLRNSTNSTRSTLMTDSKLKQFIMHFERITRHTLEEMPDRCDILLQLDNKHHVKKIINRYSHNPNGVQRNPGTNV